ALGGRAGFALALHLDVLDEGEVVALDIAHGGAPKVFEGCGAAAAGRPASAAGGASSPRTTPQPARTGVDRLVAERHVGVVARCPAGHIAGTGAAGGRLEALGAEPGQGRLLAFRGEQARELERDP